MATICPPEHAHGNTLTCTTHHGCNCAPCMAAHREYSYWRRHMIAAGRTDAFNRLIDPTGTRRRIQALMSLGWSQVQIAAHAGCRQSRISAHLYNDHVTRDSASRIAAVYEALSARVPATDTKQQRMSVHRTKALARRNGWVPPLAWDDIDNDTAPATPDPIPLDRVDEIAIELALAGTPVRLNPAERRICIRTLHTKRWSDNAIAARLRCNEKTVGRIRVELDLPAWDEHEQQVDRGQLAA